MLGGNAQAHVFCFYSQAEVSKRLQEPLCPSLIFITEGSYLDRDIHVSKTLTDKHLQVCLFDWSAGDLRCRDKTPVLHRWIGASNFDIRLSQFDGHYPRCPAQKASGVDDSYRAHNV